MQEREKKDSLMITPLLKYKQAHRQNAHKDIEKIYKDNTQIDSAINKCNLDVVKDYGDDNSFNATPNTTSLSVTKTNNLNRESKMEHEQSANNPRPISFFDQTQSDYECCDLRNKFNIPYSVLKYNLAPESCSRSIVDTDNDLQFSFTPEMNLDEVTHQSQDHHTKDTATSIPNQDNSNKHTYQEEHIGAFSGYFAIPKLTINIPNRVQDDEDRLKYISNVPTICYQNHFEIEDSTFIFGGLCASEVNSFEHLGLPPNADLEKVQIYFPFELPPFVNTRLLTNPFMEPNPYFLQYNATRGSVTYLDTALMQEFPKNIIGMASTRISSRHFFFYGGFQIENKSLRPNKNGDCWIVEKAIILNEDGYIIDTTTLKFSKVKLTRNNKSIKAGRIGMGICSNIHEPADSVLDSNFINGNHLSAAVFDTESKGSSKQFNNRTEGYAKEKTVLNPLVPLEGSHSIRDNTNTTATTTTRPTLHKINTAQSLDFHNREVIQGSPVIREYPISTESNRPLSAIRGNPSNSSSMSQPSSTGTTNSSKTGNVFTRSANIFHRHKHNDTVKSPHPLKVTYSESARKKILHSNNPSASSSRTASPMPKSFDTKIPSLTPRAISPARLFKRSPIDPIKLKAWYNTDRSSPLAEATSDINSFTTDHSQNQKTRKHVLEEDIFEREPIEFRPSPSFSRSEFEEKRGSAFEMPTGTPSDLFTNSVSIETMEEEDTANNVLFKSGANVSIFVFGGFVLDENEYSPETNTPTTNISKFKATNEMLKIDLTTTEKAPFFNSVNFSKQALVCKVGSDITCDIIIDEDENCPLPRGYFAYNLIDYLLGVDETCTINVSERESEKQQFTNLTTEKSPEDEVTNSSVDKFWDYNLPSNERESYKIQKYFESRALIVQGGCAEDNKFHGDLYRFVFKTCKWEKIVTFAFDYYNISQKPDEDEEVKTLSPENQVAEPQLKEAELRCCHHTAVYYRNEERDYLFIIGGVKNSHLRFYDTEPYTSDKFDVSRFATLQLAAENKNLLRVAVLNTRTQIWRFMRYYYDVSQAVSDTTTYQPYFTNCRFSHIGGSACINGKTITLAQGLANIAPEHKKDMDELRKQFPIEELLWGGYLQITFPGL